MKKIFFSLIALTLTFSVFSKNFEETITKDAAIASSSRIDNSALTVKVPKYIFSGLNTNVELVFADPTNAKLVENNYELFFIVNGQDVKVNFNKSGVGTFAYAFGDTNKLDVYFEDFSYSESLHIIPLWYVLAPVGFLVLYLGYKLVRSGKKNKIIVQEELQEKTENAEKNNIIEAPITNLKKEKVSVKEVVEKEEEMFA